MGFEPTVQCNPYDDLANRSFRPLRHLSKNAFVLIFEGEAKIKINSLCTQYGSYFFMGWGGYEEVEGVRRGMRGGRRLGDEKWVAGREAGGGREAP